MFKRNLRGVVLIALTHPYARMLASEFDSLPDTAIGRLRILGLKLDSCLPTRLGPQVMPYDERLDSIMPGTRADFARRALMHFVTGASAMLPDATAAAHQDWVRKSLSKNLAPKRPKRPRLSDEAIVDVIKRRLPKTQRIGQLLRLLRHQDGIACEQARFTRLFQAAVESSAL